MTWSKYKAGMFEHILNSQNRDGSWSGGYIGPTFTTATYLTILQLENGNLPLERALELFEEGMKLSENCRRQLDTAEGRIEMLVRKGDGRVVPEPFRLPDEGGK